MFLFAFGINHKTAPVSLRERAAFAPETLPAALHDLTAQAGIGEATILSTCNRTEVYCRAGRSDAREAVDWFCDYHRLQTKSVEPYLYTHPEALAVKHAFRVACGLDSMVLGEPQILGQMKQAFTTAHKSGATGKILNRLFQHTFAVAKHVRTNTAIGASPVSVAFAAVSLAKRIFSNLGERTVLLVGAGEMIELTARHLKDNGIRHLIVANRSFDRAQALADTFGGEAISLIEMPERLADADIVICCTASQLPILGKGAVERALKQRKHRPIFMVDMAVPRDIEAEVAELDDVYLYTVDDLRDVIEDSLQSRQEAAVQAEQIIDVHTSTFMRWVRSLDTVPTILALRQTAEAVRDAELARARRALAQGADPDEVLAQLARALTNKFTHGPSAALRDADSEPALLDAARKLFKLPDEN